MKIFNRPLAPHLTIYKSQITSILSIWHRFSGLLLCLFFISLLLLLKFIPLNFFLIYLLYVVKNIWLQNIIYINFFLIYFYHMLNGIRHINWDLNYNLSIQGINKTVKIQSIIFIVFIIYLFRKIIN